MGKKKVIAAPRKKKLLTAKQEKFCLRYCETGNATQALLLAGYKSKYPNALASKYRRHPAIEARLAELRQAAADESVATALERKQRLTEIVRARLADFIDEDGAPRLTKETPHHGAAADYITRTRTDREGNVVRESAIKLHDPVGAIQELNKMEGMYKESATVNITRNDIKVIEVRLAPERVDTPPAGDIDGNGRHGQIIS
jgi:phage terminase small subunit